MDKEILKKKLAEIKRSLPEEIKTEPSYPSTPQMIKNAAVSVVKNVQSVLAGNALKVEDNQASDRLNICKSCNFFDNSQMRCKKCGCQMAIKTYLKAERCPIGKW
jgi:predicted RNA-binding Zn ribbon-like protein